MPDPRIIHTEKYAKDGSYDRYRHDQAEGGEDVIVFERVVPWGDGPNERIEQQSSWFLDDFLCSDVPGAAKEKVKLILGGPNVPLP